MKYFKKPVNFETESKENIVVGYYEEKVIIKNEEEKRFYFIQDADENLYPLGTVVGDYDITPIDEIKDTNLKRQIISMFN